MIHLGDVTKIKGNEAPIVDVIVGGSPCQDLSVAGTRSGLDGERSGLFMEQIRIIKEMREKDREDGRADELVRPRWMVWENVVGAFSSGKPKGADFQRVLTEIVRIAEPDAPDVPMPDKGWPKAGCIYDDMGRWSVAWRTHDAQYFGVAQRRRRIALVADFAGLQASEVIFDPQYRRKATAQESAETVGNSGRKSKRKVLAESESLFRDSKESAEEGQGTSCSIEGSVGEPSAALSFQERAGKPGGGKGILIQDEHTGALVGQNVQSVLAYGIDQQGGKGGANYTEDVAPTVLSDSHGTPHAVAYGVTTKGNGDAFISEERHTTVSSGGGMPGQGYPTVLIENEVKCYGISPYGSEGMLSDNPHSGIYEAETSRTLDLNGGTPACNQGGIAIVTLTKKMGVSNEDCGQTLEATDYKEPQVVFPIEGNGQRESHRGDGYGKADDPSFTLNSTEQHGVAVAVDVYNQTIDGEIAATLTAASGLPNTSGPKVMVAGFKPRQSKDARTLGYEEEISPTLSTDQNYAAVIREK